MERRIVRRVGSARVFSRSFLSAADKDSIVSRSFLGSDRHHCPKYNSNATLKREIPKGGLMAVRPFSLEMIEDFLAQKRIAMIGVSRDPKHFSMALFEELCRKGYDVIPVNPGTPSINGRHCFARVQDIQPPVRAALLMTSPEVTERVIEDCYVAGIKQVWMYRAAGTGAVSMKAVEFCKAKGMDVIPGQCPFMFLPGAAGVHRLHGFLRKITGRYPRHLRAA